jgi:alpha-beta hydrolase superfamily lysophospholipase
MPTTASQSRTGAARTAVPTLGRLPMADGVGIAAYRLAPPMEARRHAVLLHGTGMHSQTYLSFARLLAVQGALVTLIDQRGHGGSEGERGQVAHDMQYADDLAECIRQLKPAHPGLPMFVLAHSGGSAIALKALPGMDGLAGLAMLAPTLAHDPLMARRRGSPSRWRDWQFGVRARPSRALHDDGRAAMRFHLGTFAAARLLGVGRKRPALVCQPALHGEAAFSYSSDAVAASIVECTQAALRFLRCPLFLATGAQDLFVNDASIHSALPWMLPPALPLRAFSYAGADHFTTLFHALKDLGAWMRDVDSAAQGT